MLKPKFNNLLLKLNVSHETIELLHKYETLLLKWNQKINLIAKSTEKIIWERHIIDSLQLLLYIKDKDIILIDAGSGAGIPGIILSICGVKQIKIVECNLKKIVFLEEAAKISPNQIEIIANRIENIRQECDIFTARGLTNLNNIFILTQNLVVKNKYILLKGESYNNEIKNAKWNWNFECKINFSVTNKKSGILNISKLEQKVDLIPFTLKTTIQNNNDEKS